MCLYNNISYINAVQEQDIQIIPDQLYKRSNGTWLIDYKYNELGNDDKIRTVIHKSLKCNNGSNKKQQPHGFAYSGIGITNNKDILVISNNCNITVTNKMNFKTNNTSIITVRYLNPNNETVSQFIESASQIAQSWENKPNSSSRVPIQGKMKHFGTKTGAGNVDFFQYHPTKWNINNVNTFHCQANKSAKIIAKTLFPVFVNNLIQTMKTLHISVHEKHGGKDGLCNEMLQTQESFVSECHVDMDMSKSFSIWTLDKRRSNDEEGWYFIFPFLTCCKNNIIHRGVAVKLKHGTCIEWDGRSIFHCSTSPTNNNVNAYGTYFGLTN